jgi:acyl-CoA reductase-like NAD-dependent aldehyde dehydrogenase
VSGPEENRRLMQGGYFFELTVLTGVTKEMQVMSYEAFEPLAAIVAFTGDQEALDIANDTECDVAGYYYSADIRGIMLVARLMRHDWSEHGPDQRGRKSIRWCEREWNWERGN